MYTLISPFLELMDVVFFLQISISIFQATIKLIFFLEFVFGHPFPVQNRQIKIESAGGIIRSNKTTVSARKSQSRCKMTAENSHFVP